MKDDGCNIAIEMHRDMIAGDWIVDRVVIRAGKIRNVTQFTSPMRFEEAFCELLTQDLRSYLPRSMSAKVISRSDYRREIGNLALEGLSVIVQKVGCGIQRVIIRFKEVAGSVQSIFEPAHRTDLVGSPSPRIPAV